MARICGPVEKLDDATFALRFDRMGLESEKRSAEIWFAATHPGDAQFKRAVQQAVLRFPLRNTEGAPPRITFSSIPNQRRDARSIALRATSDAGPDAKVRFYGRGGPAEIRGDSLVFTPIPPRATPGFSHFSRKVFFTVRRARTQSAQRKARCLAPCPLWLGSVSSVAHTLV